MSAFVLEKGVICKIHSNKIRTMCLWGSWLSKDGFRMVLLRSARVLGIDTILLPRQIEKQT